MNDLNRNNTEKSLLGKIRPFVFFPSVYFTDIDHYIKFSEWRCFFLRITTLAKDFMVIDMGWMFSIVGVGCVIVIGLAYFSPLGNVRLGGKNAKPMLKKSSWFAITLCTTIAAGILFLGNGRTHVALGLSSRILRH